MTIEGADPFCLALFCYQDDLTVLVEADSDSGLLVKVRNAANTVCQTLSGFGIDVNYAKSEIVLHLTDKSKKRQRLASLRENDPADSSPCFLIDYGEPGAICESGATSIKVAQYTIVYKALGRLVGFTDSLAKHVQVQIAKTRKASAMLRPLYKAASVKLGTKTRLMGTYVTCHLLQNLESSGRLRSTDFRNLEKAYHAAARAACNKRFHIGQCSWSDKRVLHVARLPVFQVLLDSRRLSFLRRTLLNASPLVQTALNLQYGSQSWWEPIFLALARWHSWGEQTAGLEYPTWANWHTWVHHPVTARGWKAKMK
eukprot:6043876-Amphidinium_carterae.1